MSGTTTSQFCMKELAGGSALYSRRKRITSWSCCPARDRANGNLMPGSRFLLEEAQIRHLANWQDCFLCQLWH